MTESISPSGGGGGALAAARRSSRKNALGSDLDVEGTYTRDARWGFT
jgi:hypothetical protein